MRGVFVCGLCLVGLVNSGVVQVFVRPTALDDALSLAFPFVTGRHLGTRAVFISSTPPPGSAPRRCLSSLPGCCLAFGLSLAVRPFWGCPYGVSVRLPFAFSPSSLAQGYLPAAPSPVATMTMTMTMCERFRSEARQEDMKRKA